MLVAAWLSGDLDDEDGGTLEGRMADEPALAARADRLAELAARLRGLDEVEPPPGFAARLQQRLEAERGAPSLETRRRRVSWQALTAAAAALVGVVAVGGVLSGLVGGGALDRQASEVTIEAGQPDDAAREEAQDDGAEALSLDETARAQAPAAGSADAAQAPVPPAPAIVDEGAVLDDEAALRAHLATLPVAGALLGRPLDEAEDVALAFRSELRRAAPFRTGVQPAACLETVSAGAQGPLVPARVESLVFAGEPALVYVLVDARAGSGALDRVSAWVVTPERCQTRLFAELETE